MNWGAGHHVAAAVLPLATSLQLLIINGWAGGASIEDSSAISIALWMKLVMYR